MLSRRAILRIASPSSPATEISSILGDSSTGWVSTLSVMKSRSIGLSSIRPMAGPASRPWVTAACTDVAPRDQDTGGIGQRAG
jgi:hypothetical protein